jgi:DNA-binding MarR family transcriptional regulator
MDERYQIRVYSRFVEDEALGAVETLPCVCASLRRATRALSRVYDGALAPHGLRTTQFSILARLDVEGPSPLSRFASRLGMDRTTLTRELRPLVDLGLVSLAAGDDRRQRIASLTGAGRERLEAARPAWLATQSEVAARFGLARTRSVLTELRSLTRSAAA